jgi:peptidoglycan/xylan/chitin deacetylase (PgdA/CDA1 family)
MSDFIKQISTIFPGPRNTSGHIYKSGIDAIFPFYHAVSGRPLPHMKHLYEIKEPIEFEADLDYMLEHFTPVRMSDFLVDMKQIKDDKPPMVLSFDDGLAQCYDDVMSILLRKGVPATFFLNNAFIDNKALFYRFKVSLLIEQIEHVSTEQKSKAADLLHCSISEIGKRLLSISYVEREITDQIAAAWNYSYDEYMRMNPVYLSSIQITQMIEKGFEFGSHGIDHAMFSLLKKDVALDEIQKSIVDLEYRFHLPYKFFAFPFTDSGVHDETIDILFEKKVIDAGFGTAGLKDDHWPKYYQRIPMEFHGYGARKIIRGEINRRRIRMLMGKNITIRNAGSEDFSKI